MITQLPKWEDKHIMKNNYVQGITYFFLSSFMKSGSSQRYLDKCLNIDFINIANLFKYHIWICKYCIFKYYAQ